MRSMVVAVAVVSCLIGLSTASETQAAVRKPTSIAPQQLGSALQALAAQREFQIIYRSDVVASRHTQGASGNLTQEEALRQLLSGTGLTFRYLDEKTVTILAASGASAPDAQQVPTAPASMPPPPAPDTSAEDAGREPGTQSDADQAPSGTRPSNRSRRYSSAGPVLEERGVYNMPEIVVYGARTFNVDVERTEDDPQPYVVFDSDEIERAQVTNLEEFFRTRLPMNAAQGSTAQNSPGRNFSDINLRGLGSDQTLILVDGRRLPGISIRNTLQQPDINGIPVSAIERIEVLPSTASGIYGGGATGGVINIILKRNYSGLQAQATYADTFDTSFATRKLEAHGGFSLGEGRTNVMVVASHVDGGQLLVKERDFSVRARGLMLENNPTGIGGPLGNVPPLGGTVNIGSITGQPLTLTTAFGGASLGSNHTHVPLGYAGPGSDNAQALIANAGSYNLDLPNDLNGRLASIMSSPGGTSVSMNARQAFGERVEAFVNVASLENEGEAFTAGLPVQNFLAPGAPNNPFNQFLVVTTPWPGVSFQTRSSTEALQATGGIIVRLPHDWSALADYNWSRSTFESEGTGGAIFLDDAGRLSLITGQPSADGRPALDVLQETNTFPLDLSPYLMPTTHGEGESTLREGNVRISGPVLDLPAGPLRVTGFVGRRKELQADAFAQSTNPTSLSREQIYSFFPHTEQNADNFQLEMQVPLISASNALRFVRALDLQASVRRDEYETTGAPIGGLIVLPSRDAPRPPVNFQTNQLESTDYTVALRFQPLEDVTLRSSFGTGFLPPSISQVAAVRITGATLFGTDPKRGNVPTLIGPITFLQGGNPDVKPELSDSWSAGLIFTPRFAPGLRLSADYTHIEKEDEIASPNITFLFQNEDDFPGRIARAPLTDADRASNFTGCAILEIDTTLFNITSTEVDAYDFQIDYEVPTGRFGAFRFFTVASWQPHLKFQNLPTTPVLDSAGFTGGPLKWRGNAGVTWERGPWTLGWNAQYYGAYSVLFAGQARVSPSGVVAFPVLSQGTDTIASQTYHDFTAGYRTGNSGDLAGGWLDDIDIRLGVQNVFDESPPIIASSAAFGGYSFYGDPRLRRFSLSVRKSFGGGK